MALLGVRRFMEFGKTVGFPLQHIRLHCSSGFHRSMLLQHRRLDRLQPDGAIDAAFIARRGRTQTGQLIFRC